MQYRFIAGSVVSVAMAVCCIGCAKVPQAEIDNAQAAVAAAQAAEADQYAVGEFSAAQDSLKAGLDEVGKQQAASALGRNFDKAKARLSAVVTIAGSAKTHAALGKENAKSEANALAARAASAAGDVKTMLDKASKGKDPKAKADKEALSNDFKSVTISMGEAQQTLAAGRYADARSKFNFVMTKLESLKGELTKASTPAALKAAKKEKNN